MVAADAAAVGMFFIPRAYALNHRHRLNPLQPFIFHLDHFFELPLCHYPLVFAVEISLWSNFFPARGQDEGAMVEEFLLVLMYDLRPVITILLFKPDHFSLRIEMNRFMAFDLLDEILQKGLRIRSLQGVKRPLEISSQLPLLFDQINLISLLSESEGSGHPRKTSAHHQSPFL